MNRPRAPRPHALFSRFAAAPKPTGPDALYAQALALYQQGQWEAAVALCRDKLLSQAPHHWDGLSLLGVACFLQDDLPGSEQALQAAIAAGAGDCGQDPDAAALAACAGEFRGGNPGAERFVPEAAMCLVH